MSTSENDFPLEEWLDENGPDPVEVMLETFKQQQTIAYQLTKLVLEHCENAATTKEEVFQLYREALEFAGSSINLAFSEGA